METNGKMKKLLLMLLVIVGGVMSANATDVTRRIAVQLEDNAAGSGLVSTWDGWKEKVYIHAYYNDGSDHNLTGNWLSTEMTLKATYSEDSKARKIYWADIVADESIFTNYDITIILTGNGNEGGNNRNTTNVGKITNDKIAYLYIENGNVSASYNDVTYCMVDLSGEGYTGKTLAALTCDNGVCTGTYTNTSSSKYASVTPTYNLWDTTGANAYGVRSNDLLLRPANSGSDYVIDAFQVWSDNLTGEDKCFKFDLIDSYDLTFDVFQKTFTITPYRTTTIGSAGYATYSNGENYTVSGATVYTVSAKNGNYVTLTEQTAGTVLPGGETGGVILAGSGDVTINAVASGTAATMSGTNYLKGTGNSASSPSTGDDIYVLANDNSNGVGFYKASGGELAAHKAYLDLTGVSGAREFLGFSFDDEPSGISEVGAKATDGAAYNLQGVRIGKLQKGINIVNGKKVMVK